jgi:hypothetical protein
LNPGDVHGHAARADGFTASRGESTKRRIDVGLSGPAEAGHYRSPHRVRLIEAGLFS